MTVEKRTVQILGPMPNTKKKKKKKSIIESTLRKQGQASDFKFQMMKSERGPQHEH